MSRTAETSQHPGHGRRRCRPCFLAVVPALLVAIISSPDAGAGYVQVNGHALWYQCQGSGRPTVVLEAGSPDSSTVWRSVEPMVARFTRVCAYDRAGIGESAPPPSGHRTGETQVEELRSLLRHAGIQGPIVLVGHSWGGLLARLFAHRYPHFTAGIVLVDATTFPYGEPPLLPGHTTSREGIDVQATQAQSAAVTSLDDLPLVVLGHGRPALNSRFLAEQDGEARLSNDSIDAIARTSGHYIQKPPPDGQPDVVIDAIRAVVDTVRRHTRLPTCRAIFPAASVGCRS